MNNSDKNKKLIYEKQMRNKFYQHKQNRLKRSTCVCVTKREGEINVKQEKKHKGY